MKPISTPWKLAAALLLAALALAAYLLWPLRPPAPAAVAEAPAAAAPEAPAPPAPASAAPAVRHPIDAASAPGDAPPASPDDANRAVVAALGELVGQTEMLRFLLPEHFVRHAVATVDALGREHAAPRLWPVAPTPGRFTTAARDGAVEIAEANAARYAPFVRFASAVDPGRAAALYKRFYPWFQQAYEQLGYPGRHFNDRLVDVIDLLLQTPEPGGPLAVRLTEVKGPIEPTRPWVRYEFADPALEARPAGQKILLRMGVAQARVLKAQLAAFRAEIAAP